MPGEFRLAEFTITPALGRISGPGGVGRLEPKVMDLLVYLAERPGQVVDKAEIVSRVWQGVAVTDDVISRAVYQMRKAFGSRKQANLLIETVPKRGYRCTAALEALRLPRTATAAAKPRVAVLPLENLSPDPSHAFFADGLHEEIVSTLAQRIDALEVLSRTSMMRYRSRPPDSLQELAGQLGATHVIEGSVRRDGQEIRVTLQIIDAGTDRHLWARSYDRTIGNSIGLQADIAGDLAGQLSLQMAATTQHGVAPTADFTAYEIYLRAKLARQLLNPSRSMQQIAAVDALYGEAIARDPRFALAIAERMRVRTWMIEWNYDVSEAAKHAVHEDLQSLRTLLSRDHYLVQAAEALYWSEVEYEPVRALNYYLAAESSARFDAVLLLSKARLLLRMNRIAEAIDVVQQACAHSPGNAVLLNISTLLHLAARKPMEAIQLGTLAIQAGAVALGKIYATFAFTGETVELRNFLRGADPGLDAEYRVQLSFRFLLLDGCLLELKAILAAVTTPTLRVGLSFIGVMLAGLGRRPIAELRGWVDLALGNPQAAAREGRAVLEFVVRSQRTLANRWFLALTAATGTLFIGDKKRAAIEARAALAMAPRTFDAVAHVEAAYIAAVILAWSGALDESVEILTELTSSIPGIGPAFAKQDPLCAMPLSRHAGYRALVARIDIELAHNKRMTATGGK